MNPLKSSLLQAILEKDARTAEHCIRVHKLSMLLADCLGFLPDEALQVLEVASLMHDIGKIGIPDNILLSHFELTSLEFEVMKTHSNAGSRIIKASGIDGSEEVADVIVQTHEHFDGSGYPDNVSGSDINLLARIIAVADGFDAMTQARTYKRAFSRAETLDIIKSGTTYDPMVVTALAKIVLTR